MPNIWPWSRIAELETQVRVMETQSRARIDALVNNLDNAEKDNDILLGKLREARTPHAKLQAQLADAHLRDPKTGRILPKGAVL
jgi:hypothetical protein